MPTLADLRPGDLAFGPIHGAAGAVVAAGQIAVAPWKHQLTWKTWWRVRHVGVIVAASESPGQWSRNHVRMAQAMPGGAEIALAGDEHWTDEWTYIRPRWQYAEQAGIVAETAITMADRKIPYNWLDYEVIAAHRLHLPGAATPYVNRLDRNGVPIRAICSQLADAALTLGGFTVFDDHRQYGEVVPAELYLRLLELGPELIIRPGVRTEGAVELDHRRDLGTPGGYQGYSPRYSLDHWL